ncbi:MAG: diaminopimelate epimerase [candidate division Zixibacteria bacterium]|nr:diaminopimelate epimerase [candidate division Zixibacteria bacterium]
MRLPFAKYHALGNDFIVVVNNRRLGKKPLSRLARRICHRRTGVGADGLLCLTASAKKTLVVDLFNADSSWAEKSGNGLRILGLHQHLKDKRRRNFVVRMAGLDHHVSIVRATGRAGLIKTDLGSPEFTTGLVPVRTRKKYLINAPLTINGFDLPVTCLSVGNPHTVLFVDNFDFDWRALGAEIETSRVFPNHTNVEFVKVVSRRRLLLADWERGAGATGSSGTGAAAAVCAAVMTGHADRRCQVVFETGSLWVDWKTETNNIELTGPVEFVAEGFYEFEE